MIIVKESMPLDPMRLLGIKLSDLKSKTEIEKIE